MAPSRTHVHVPTYLLLTDLLTYSPTAHQGRVE